MMMGLDFIPFHSLPKSVELKFYDDALPAKVKFIHLAINSFNPFEWCAWMDFACGVDSMRSLEAGDVDVFILT